MTIDRLGGDKEKNMIQIHMDFKQWHLKQVIQIQLPPPENLGWALCSSHDQNDQSSLSQWLLD